MIASNIFMELNADIFSSSLLYHIVHHKRSGEATRIADKHFGMEISGWVGQWLRSEYNMTCIIWHW